MRIFLEFLLTKMQGAINYKAPDVFYQYSAEMENALADSYVDKNPDYDDVRDKYKLLLRKAKDL